MCAVSGPASAKRVKIKLGTLAPEGSAWHTILLRMGQRWSEASDGKVRLKIYPGGVVGDEADVIRRMRINQLQAGTLTGLGLGLISRSTIALQIPMLFDSWEQLDYVRDRVGPKIASELADQGFVVLHWGDVGWVHNFSTVPAVTPDDYRKLKLFVRAGAPEDEKLWRAAGFSPVPVSPTDVLAGLQTGMLEAFGATPLFGLASQWFGLAKYMVKVKWSPLNGATVVTRAAWARIDAKVQARLIDIARDEGVALRRDVRALNIKAIKAMSDRGLKVIEPDAKVIEAWRKVAVDTYPSARGKVVPETYFDEVMRLAAEYKVANKK